MENKTVNTQELINNVTAFNGMPMPLEKQVTEQAQEQQVVNANVQQEEQQTQAQDSVKPGHIEILSFAMGKDLKLSWKKENSKLFDIKNMSQRQVFDMTTRVFVGGKYRPAIYSYKLANHALNNREMVSELKLRRIIEEAFDARTQGRINEIILKLRQKQFICPGVMKDGLKVFLIGKAMHEFHDSFFNEHVHTCPPPTDTESTADAE